MTKPTRFSKFVDFVLKIIRQLVDKLFDPYDQ